MARRSYRGASVPTTLVSSVTAGATSLSVLPGGGTSLPDAIAGPFVITVNTGGTTEEKILVATRVGDNLSGLTRGYDGTSAAAHTAGETVRHTISAVDLDEANAHVNASSGVHGLTGAVVDTTTAQTLTNKSLTQAQTHFSPDTDAATTSLHHTLGASATQAAAGNHTHAAGSVTKVIRLPYTFTLYGPVTVASGDTAYIAPFFIPEPATQAVTLVAARYVIHSGTSATVKLQINGVDATGFTGLSVTTTATTTDPADVALSDGDQLSLVVTAVSGTPTNLTFSVFLEYAI